MIDKNGYLESLVDTDLEKLIITNIDKDPETIIEMCLDLLKGDES